MRSLLRKAARQPPEDAGIHRIDFVVRVCDADEAREALAAGADRLLIGRDGCTVGEAETHAIMHVAGSARVSVAATLPRGEAPDKLCKLADDGIDALIVPADASALRRLAEMRDHAPALRGIAAFVIADDGTLPDLALLGALAEAGFRSAILLRGPRPAPRLIDRPGIEALAQFIEGAQRRGLQAGLAGGLEAPDVPRMLALRPDFLVFGASLCIDDDPSARLDAERMRMMRTLVPQTQAASTSNALSSPMAPRARDKVFIRDFVIEAGIGLYRFEHRKAQRMRFNVEADLVSIPDDVTDMRDVFSYDVIVDAIRLATRRHVLLVERIALDVATATLRDARVQRVRVRIEKLDVLDGSVGVEIERDRAMPPEAHTA